MFVNASKITGKVVGTIRHGHTIYGNPTMSVKLELLTIDGTPVSGYNVVTVRIQNNSGIVYGIENREYKEYAHEYTLTRAGRISHVVRSAI